MISEARFRSREKRLMKARKLVERIRAGEHIVAVAREQHVNPVELSAVCREMGVIVRPGRPRGPGMNEKSPPLRFRGVDWTRSDAELAEALDCTRQAVNYVRRKLIRLEVIEPRSLRGRSERDHKASAPKIGRLPSLFAVLVKQVNRGEDRGKHLLAVTRPYTEAALERINCGRAHDRKELLSLEQLLALLNGLKGSSRATAILALMPLACPMNEDSRSKLLEGIDPKTVTDLETLLASLARAISKDAASGTPD
jgi:hypothetical protein